MHWIKTNICTIKHAKEMVHLYKASTVTYAAFDTETTGLHIIYDKPFLFQFGWVDLEASNGYTFTVDIERRPLLANWVISVWHVLVKDCPVYAAHNTKYDLHMLHNIGHNYEGTNLTDTQIYIRAATDNVPERSGGASLKLKKFSKKYIDLQAGMSEKLLTREKSDKVRAINKDLQERFKKVSGDKWPKKRIESLFNDVCFTPDSLSPEYLTAYNAWLNNLHPQIKLNLTKYFCTTDSIPYNLLNRKNLIDYGHDDIIYVLKILMKLTGIINSKDTKNTVELENKCIMPLYRMERVGFKVDVAYLNKSIRDTKNYILDQRKNLYELINTELRVNQHKKVKQILLEQYETQVESTGKNALTALVKELPNKEAKIFIVKLQELRTLEKWIQVYMNRFIKDLRKTKERLYTSINQVGAASGRVTSNFQQFPKGKLYKEDGSVLANPRKMILAEENGIVYLDYSQIELRLQAMYTILVGEPDMNLCRAYMPYKCVNKQQEVYNCRNKIHRDSWNSGEWTLEESQGTLWIPTDVHGATTKYAFDIDETHKDFKKLRSVGKHVNFAKNYGAKFEAIKNMFPEFSDERIHKIDEAYYLAFPGIKAYQNYCYQSANKKTSVRNLLGIRYYNVSGHNLINMLIQGSGAYFLKEKIIEVDKYLQTKHSKFQMNIHDELCFIWDKRDPFTIFYEIKTIMESWEDTLVPIIADMEISKTNWSEKEDI